MKLKAPQLSIARFGVFLLPLTLLMTGCQGALETSWVGQDDTPAMWDSEMNTISFEVHGVIPGASESEMLAQIPHSTTAAEDAKQHPAERPLGERRLIVVYVATNQIPSDRTVCTSTPVLGLSSHHQKRSYSPPLCVTVHV